MKNLFESPFFAKITRVADFFLVSVLFLVTSLPLITCFTALTATYYTMAKVLRYEAGTSTVGCYFHAFKENLKQGLLFGVLLVAAAVILYTFVDVANAVGWHTLYSRIYLVLTIVYGSVVIAMLLNLIAIVSRFKVKSFDALRLAWLFLRERPFKLLTYVISLVGAVLLAYIFPPLALLMPGGYCFSLTYYAEPILRAYMEENLGEEMIPDWMKEDADGQEN